MKNESFKFKIPGKIMLNGGYLVLHDEPCISVTLDSYLNASVSIRHIPNEIYIECNGQECLLKFIDNQWNIEPRDNHFIYIQNIVNVLNFPKNMGLHITANLNSKFNCGKSKTGMGSSSCILVCLVYIYERLNKSRESIDLEEFTKKCIEINSKISIGSSGYDVTSCSIGCIVYKNKKWERINLNEKYLVLGSLGTSTDSRKMIKKIVVDDKWNKLREINRRIVNGDNLYEEYLDELRNLSNEIVPDIQYEFLKKTFSMGIKKCGVSGGGGEDAVWALTNDPEELKMWYEMFPYVHVCKIVPNGLIEE